MIDTLRILLSEATAVLLDDGWHSVNPKETKVKGHNAEDIVIFSEIAFRSEPTFLACRLSDVKAVRKVD